MLPAGSTTFGSADLDKGLEPDECYYIQNRGAIHGVIDIDLAIHPPPDLAVEVDITSWSKNRLPLYAAIGVPEVWRYDGHELAFLVLKDGRYDRVLLHSHQQRCVPIASQLVGDGKLVASDHFGVLVQFIVVGRKRRRGKEKKINMLNLK